MNFSNTRTFHFKDQSLTLLAQRALFWEEKEMLIVSDVHAGKSGHFRKNGIAVPETVNEINFERLDNLIQQVQPKLILYLGDLFHSDLNTEVHNFSSWRNKHSNIEMLLTLGNHDILSSISYTDMNVTCVTKYICEPFVFIHDPEHNAESDAPLYPIAGHIHPSIKFTGKGKQQVYLPCFYFGEHYGLIPAFGAFTGNHQIKPVKNDYVFALVENDILEIHLNN